MDNEYDSFISKFINSHLFNISEQTKKTYKYNLKKFCNWAESEGLNISSISEREIKNYIIYLTSKNISSVRQQKNIIVRFMKFSIGKEFNIKVFVNSNNVKNKKHVNVLSIEKATELMEMAIERAKKDNNIRDVALLTILFGTGLRVGEIESLNRTNLKESYLGAYLDVNVSKKFVRYYQSTRRIPIEPYCDAVLKQYIKLRNDSNRAMLMSKNGQRLSIRGIQNILKKYGVSSYSIRKMFIMGLIDKGVNARQISSIMGYKSTEIVSKYFDSSKDPEYTAFKNLTELYNKDK